MTQISDEMILAAAKAMAETPPDERYEERDGKTILVRDFRQTAFAALEAALTPSAGEAEPVAWLAEGAGWGRVFIDKEAAEKLAAQDGTLKPLYTRPSPSASEVQVRVRVKALDWKDGIGLSTAQTNLVACYSVWDVDDEFWLCSLVEGRFQSMEAAKAAAQADYERRILSALTSEQGETEAGVQHAALADRLEAEIKRLDDTPPSIQSQANIRLINAVHEAIALLRGSLATTATEDGR